MSNGKRTGGGSATAAGALFQSAASAWYCVGILAEQDFPTPLGLPSSTTLKFIRCETDEPVDDILVITSDDGLIFAQAKHSLSLESGDKSELASALDQCVRQYLRNQSNSQKGRPWNRPLVATTDRLVIVVGHASSGPIRNDVPAFLENVRTLAGRPLDDAAVNDDQKRVFAVLRTHTSEAWRIAAGSAPSDSELLAVFSLLRIQVLALDPDGADERQARTLLRTSVLQDPNSDSNAWDLLGRFCEELAATRRAADRQVLHGMLLAHSIDVEAPRSYRADIAKLREHTKTSLSLLRELGMLRVGSETISIERQCSRLLEDAAMKGSLLVTGDPGSGKSGLLHWLSNECQIAGIDCVVLLVDRIASASRGELRGDLGLEHEVHEVLRNWPSRAPGIVLVDALDAAREDSSAQTIRDVIRLALAESDRWNVVATIRKFDLRYSEELKELFRGTPPASFPYSSDEFKRVRHVNVPVLNDAELLEIARCSPALGGLLSDASQPLRELLRNAFNIRLAADLVTSGLAATEFRSIRTQLELLERYWRFRILGPDADAREQLLRSASEAMVMQRSLRVDRQTVAAHGGSALSTLLSRNVLVEWQKSEGSTPNRYILSYSHHVLHDYAIARLILRGDRTRLLARLNDGDFALVARPSISMHFSHLWADDPAEFWQLSFDVLGLVEAPKILQLVGSTVAAELFSAADEMAPLSEKLTSQNPGVAPRFFTHFVGAIVALGIPLVGSQARPWWPFLVGLSESLAQEVAVPLQGLLGLAVDRSVEATRAQLESLGRVALALLRFAWPHTSQMSSMVWVGMQGVCRALRVQPNGREELRRFIDPERIQNFGYVEAPWLAHEITHIIDADPDLALDVYRAIFAHDEPSQEPTPMSRSRILSLTSNKRQDYGMALWELAEKYPYFLAKAPAQATIALTFALDSYVLQRHRYGERTQAPDQRFEFRGSTVELHDDGSGIWDSGDVYSSDDGVKLLNAFAEHVLLLSQQGDRTRLEEALDLLAAHQTSAVIWRRLLLIASEEGGEALASLVAPLLLSSRFLLAPDIGYAAGEFLRTRVSALDDVLRGRIEDAILGTVDGVDNREYAEYKRAKLVGCLPESAIVRDAMRELAVELRTEGNVPENKENTYTLRTEGYTEESHLRGLGVKPDAPDVKRLVELYGPLREFSNKFVNDSPTGEDVRTILPTVVAVHEALIAHARTPETEKLIDHAWGYLAAACASVADAKPFSCGSADGQIVLQVLLQAARNVQPIFSEAADAQFNQHPSWGSPAARIDAAQGLALLGQYTDCLSEELRTAIRTMARDPVAAVRYQISRSLVAFYSSDQQFFWELTRSFVGEESNRGVLDGVVHSIAQVAPTNLDDAIALLLTIRRRIAPAPTDRSELRRSIDSRIAQAYVYRGHRASEQHIRSLLETSDVNASALSETLHSLRSALTYQAENEDDTAIRARTFALFIDMLRTGEREIRGLETSQGEPFASWSDADQQRAKDLNDLVRGVADQVYFASGAFDDRKETPQDEASKKRSERFYEEAGALLDELTSVRIAAASHHLIETLAYFVNQDPEGVFLRIAKAVKSASAGGYAQEGLGAKLVVTIVERYIAEYRSLFQEDAFRRALMEVLDIFVEAGWPSARKLIFQLDEMFR